jgi:hypothetical protein
MVTDYSKSRMMAQMHAAILMSSQTIEEMA